MRNATSSTVKERRTHHRQPLVCDVWEHSAAGPDLTCSLDEGGLAGRTLNVSDGGALIQLTRAPQGGRLRQGGRIDLTVALPRSTADTYLIEHVRLPAEVVRVQTVCDDGPANAFAVRFTAPTDLQLD